MSAIIEHLFCGFRIRRFLRIFLLSVFASTAVAQWTQQGPKLVGTVVDDERPQQGQSVALSSDGNTAIVGGPRGIQPGGAWVFIRGSGVWTQQGPKLVGTGAAGTVGCNQGQSVSISGDGNTAIVGGFNDNNGLGAVWAFTRSAGVWTQQGSKFVGTGATGTFSGQGFSASISTDGNTALVGGPYDDNGKGAAWIFIRSGGVWGQEGPKLVGTGAVGNAAQGYSVSISADGNTAIVGGASDDASRGAAWIFVRSGGVWTQQGSKLVGADVPQNGGPIISVSISADGNTALLGRSGHNLFGPGALWVFTRNGGVWSQQGPKLVGTGAVGNAGQGCSVSLSADGNTAIVGGHRDNSNQGATWVFTRLGGVWTQQGSKLFGTGVAFGAQQGLSVSISSDAGTAIVGGPADSVLRGASWIFSRGIEISNPQAGERLIAGEQDTIRWTGGQAGQYVNLELSTDSGATYSLIDFAVPADSGYYIWTVPDSLTTRARVRVRTITTPMDTAVSDTFKVKGYVLTRFDANGNYEAFAPNKHGWSYQNGTLWPRSWWMQFQYTTVDDPNTFAPYPSYFHTKPDSSFIDWPLFVDVFSADACYWSTGLGVYKGDAQDLWKATSVPHFGSCYGFSAASILAFGARQQFFQRHPAIPNVSNIFSLGLTTPIRSIINGYYAHQFGEEASTHINSRFTSQDPRTTLQELRNMLKEDVPDGRTVCFFNQAPQVGGHAVTPISITPDPSGQSRYRVNVYDSNTPGQTGRYILVDSLNNTWSDFTVLGWTGGSVGFFLDIPASHHLVTPEIDRPVRPAIAGGNVIKVFNTPRSNILHTASNGNSVGYINGGLIQEIAEASPIIMLSGQPSDPLGFVLPEGNYSSVLGNTSSPAYLTVIGATSITAYERQEVDSVLEERFHFGDGFSVTSGDTAAKTIALHIIAQLDSSERMFFVQNSQLRQNDSLFTQEVSQSTLVLKNFGSAKTYDLEINERSAQEQEVFSHPSLVLEANSSHTLAPNWNDLKGSPVEILVDLGNNGTIDDTLIVNNTVDVDDRGELNVPREHQLAQNYPNPFNPTTRIEYALPQAGHVKLTVHNLLGQLVATLVDGEHSAGRFATEWNGMSSHGTNVGSGVYIYMLKVGGASNGSHYVQTRKMILIR